MAATFQIPVPSSRPGEARPAGRPQLVHVHGGGAAVRRPSHTVYLVRRLLVVTIAVLLLAAGWALVSGGAAGTSDAVPTSYQVGAHDTLWSIAGRLGIDADRRVVVDLLAEANGGTAVRPGQWL